MNLYKIYLKENGTYRKLKNNYGARSMIAILHNLNVVTK